MIMIMQTNTQPDEQTKISNKNIRVFHAFFFSAKKTVVFQLLRGIDKLAETVAVTLGPRGRNVLLDKAGLVAGLVMRLVKVGLCC